MTGRHPLTWPEGWPRTRKPQPAGNTFGKTNTLWKAAISIHSQLELMGAEDVQLSSDLQLRNDGMPRSGQRLVLDPAVAVYFTRDGENLVIACDLYDRIEANMRAVALIVESTRRIERYGGDRMMKRVYTGFLQITGPVSEPWWEVLCCKQDADMHTVDFCYRNLVKTAHPDAGGSDKAMERLNKAIQEARVR